MKRILEFQEFTGRETTQSRTNALTGEEFLKVFNENCKNFSFDNDQLWRAKGPHGSDFGLFVKSERKGVIGDFGYKDFFDFRTDNPDYPVERHSSLIGSTEREGSDFLAVAGGSMFITIPFDNTDIVFVGCPDMGILGKLKKRRVLKFSDDLFILKKYTENFKVPEEELKQIFLDNASDFAHVLDEGLGFEYFTNGPCLLLHESKIDWLKSIVG